MHVTLAITGAPLAARASNLIGILGDAGHRVTACLSAAAQNWAHIDERWLPNERVRPDALVVIPATFNTLNKWAAGINDSVVLGVLNDALGLDVHILVVPMVADRLAAHPAWPNTLALLTGVGVQLLDPVTGAYTDSPASITSGSGDQVAERFQPAWILNWLHALVVAGYPPASV